MRSEEARQRAQAEGLTLRVANNGTGYSCVYHADPVARRRGGRSNRKPYMAQVRRRGKDVYLGSFLTAEQAALCVARSPEGQAAAQRAAATGDDDGGDDTGEESEEETFEVLDAVEVLVASDDEEEEALAMEAEEVTRVVERKRAREAEHEPRRRGASR